MTLWTSTTFTDSAPHVLPTPYGKPYEGARILVGLVPVLVAR